MPTGGGRRGAGGGGGSTRKCATTGHFFICNPKHVSPFACFECHQRFAPPTKSTLYSSNPCGSHHSRVSSDSSLKKPLGQSLLSSETQTVTNNTESSFSCQPSHLPISKPWRCLVENCLFLACDKCSDALIAQAGIGDQVGASKRKADSLSSLPADHPDDQKPGISTPENRPCTQEGPLKVNADVDNSHGDPEEPATKLVYRRAEYAADSAIAAHYHRRAPRKVNRSPPGPFIATKTMESIRATSKLETSVTSSSQIISEMLQVDDSVANGEDGDDDDEAWIATRRASIRSAKQAGQRAVKKAYLRQKATTSSLEQFG